MPIFVPVNHRFFDNWNPEMAYVLGFFAADGCLTINPRGAKYLEFTSADEEIIIKIRDVMFSRHKISSYQPLNRKWRTRYRIQIGSKYLFTRLTVLGFTVNKSLTLKFPKIPNEYFSHFVRGYFDGDGCIGRYTYHRKDRANRLHTITLCRFTSGSHKFLRDLQFSLRELQVVSLGSLFKKPKGGFDLQFAFQDSVRLGRWMYYHSNGLYLERKYQKFKKILGA